MRTEMERVEDVMEYMDDPVMNSATSAAEEYAKLSGRVEMKNITFGYSRLSEPVIRDFSMTL